MPNLPKGNATLLQNGLASSEFFTCLGSYCLRCSCNCSKNALFENAFSGEPASAPREVKWSNRTSEAFFNEDVVAASTFTFKVQRMFFK